MKHICTRARARIAPLALFALSLAACEINPFTEETVTVALPPSIPVIDLVAPGADLRWTVTWFDGSLERRELKHARGNVRIALERGAFTPIIAAPETAPFGIPESFLPRAGAIYPDACEGERATARADWAGGVCAEIAESVLLGASGGIETGRVIARHFNWGRLERTVDATPLPNRIDRARLVDSILSLDTTKRDVTAGTLAELRAEAVAEALANAGMPVDETAFLPEWPTRVPVCQGSFPVRVACGITRFYAQAGYLTVIATGGSVSDCFFSRYVLQD